MTTTAIISIISFLKRLLNFFLDGRRKKHEIEKIEQIEEANDELKTAVHEGDLSDLISAAKKIGELKKWNIF